jgi:hypothetical protein
MQVWRAQREFGKYLILNNLFFRPKFVLRAVGACGAVPTTHCRGSGITSVRIMFYFFAVLPDDLCV